ncbi:MAG: proton-conducting transporter membrane subunit [Chloroflexi bacterium]|nr:proton-conducting transporter membrane subunit [Chloroflexota bacterium]
MTFFFLIFPPLLAALLASFIRPYRAFVGWIGAWLSLISLGAALIFVSQVVNGQTPTWGLESFNIADVFRADSLSVLIMLCVTSVATLALFLSPGLGRQVKNPHWGELAYGPVQLRRYHVFINLFIAAMLLAVSANNVGIMWIMIEATTVFSAFIIPLKLNKASIEASWKYIIICSVGIALAFVGTVLGYFDFFSLSGRAENALNWPVLLATAPVLHPEVMRLAFVFLLVGYGTKAGIAPMHTWKPDAYGESPAPLTALMSSSLFAVAMYALLRWKVVADATLGAGYTDGLFMALGLLSLVIAAFSVVLATDYKRMFAYSSIEHTGLMCLGFALGPLGTFAALLHLLNHTAAKSLMFFLVDNIEHKYRSPLILKTRGLLKTMPWTGALFAFGLMTLIGLPPGGIFITEFALFRAGFALGYPWLMGVALALLAVVFVSFINHLNKMLYGMPSQEEINPERPTERFSWRIALLFINVAVLVTLGLTMPTPLATLLQQSVAIISRR